MGKLSGILLYFACSTPKSAICEIKNGRQKSEFRLTQVVRRITKGCIFILINVCLSILFEVPEKLCVIVRAKNLFNPFSFFG